MASSASASASAASTVDDDLARATSVGLSLDSSSIVVNIVGEMTRVLLPRELHPGLYDNSIGDASMTDYIMEGRSSSSSVGNDDRAYSNGNRSRRASKAGGGGDDDDDDSGGGGNGGVPGFPDFPDRWQGEASIARGRRIGWGGSEMSPNRGPTRHARSIVRRAVNKYGIVVGRKSPAAMAAASRGGDGIKIRMREERRARRSEREAKLRERRKRKSDMGIIRRGLENIECK
jgi:hypothetical protein